MTDLSSSSDAVKHLLVDAGAAWVLWLLAALSLASLGVTLERWLLYRRVSGDLEPVATEFHARWARGEDPEQTRAWLESSPLIASRIAAAGLWLAPRGAQAAQKAMASRVALERDALEARLAFLATLGNNAPFVGLFGTVIGVIQAFEALGQSSASQMASGAVMSAIAEALVATAVGIAVALPAVAAYNYLDRRVQSILAGAEVLSNLVLAYICKGDELTEDPS